MDKHLLRTAVTLGLAFILFQETSQVTSKGSKGITVRRGTFTTLGGCKFSALKWAETISLGGAKKEIVEIHDGYVVKQAFDSGASYWNPALERTVILFQCRTKERKK